jgi:hypothetical protein
MLPSTAIVVVMNPPRCRQSAATLDSFSLTGKSTKNVFARAYDPCGRPALSERARFKTQFYTLLLLMDSGVLLDFCPINEQLKSVLQGSTVIVAR